MMWVWFALAIGFLVVELSTTQFVSIWFSVAAFITGIIVAIFGELGIGWQIAIFVILSVVALFATKPLIKKLKAKPEDGATNMDLNIGKHAVVVEKIDNVKGTGAIKINGLLWTARSDDDSEIEEGQIVTFSKINGNKAIVSLIKKEENTDD